MEEHHEPIISKEVFDAAKHMLEQHAKENNITRGDGKYQKHYPFTGKIICGECGTVFKRRINITGTLRYPAWVCQKHIRDKESCSMKFIREDAIERAFAVMMNKLVFARNEILQPLSDAVANHNHDASLLRVNEIDAALGKIEEQKQNLTVIMAKHFIDRALYIQETNCLFMEEAAMKEERERLVREINGGGDKKDALQDLLGYTRKGGMLSEFDAELFGRFVDSIKVCSREEAIFHLKCGLCLRERIG